MEEEETETGGEGVKDGDKGRREGERKGYGKHGTINSTVKLIHAS